jgi:glycosyltransferase involved in cell wall biosynthesis
MLLGIDASNIRGGGGVNHLVELLRSAKPNQHGFDKVIIWGGAETLSKISDRDWIVKKNEPFLNKSLFYRIYWQKFQLSSLARKTGCDLLFIPGGSFSGNFSPFVTMSQNLLPFEWKEIRRYGFSKFAIRLIFLRLFQSRTFLKANGIIFLTEYARGIVLNQFPIVLEKTLVVNHGISSRFHKNSEPRPDLSLCDRNNPIRVLYISFIGEYKHQWNVVKGLSLLSKREFPIELTLVGSIFERKAYKKLVNSIKESIPTGLVVNHIENLPYLEIHDIYDKNDIFIFASSCETFGQIVTEAMASALPIACSNLSSMKELLGKSAVYFNPDNPVEISESVERLLKDKNLRDQLSVEVKQKSMLYTWDKCALETFSFFKEVLSSSKAIDSLTESMSQERNQ